MKKKVLVILCVAVLMCTVAVAIGVSETNKIVPTEIELRVDKLETAEFYKNDETDNMYDLIASRYSGDELSEKTEIYTLYKTVDKPSREVLEYMYALALKGADIETIVDICSFWDTTNENIDMIGKIYAEYNELYEKNPYWIEDVFNELTNNIHGVLSEDDVRYWLDEKNMTVQDISEANVMSRKGVYTIQEILTLKDRGKSWSSIAADIYGGNVTSAYDNLSAKTVMDAVYLAKRTGTEMEVYLGKALKNEHTSLDEEKQSYLDESTEGVFKKLTERKLWNLPTAERQQNEKHQAEMKEEIINKGISAEEYETKKSQGVSDIEILNETAIAR